MNPSVALKQNESTAIKPAATAPIHDGDPATVSQFGEDSWSLHALAGKATAGLLRLDFTTVPPCYKETSKRIVWAMINLETPVDLLERSTAVRTRVTAGTVCAVFTDIRAWLRWLTRRGIERLCDVEEETSRLYGKELASQSLAREYKGKRLFSISRVWLLAPYLPETDKLARPTWESEQAADGDSLEDLLGPANWSAENKTIPVHPQTMSALLVCALRFVETFAADILAAVAAKKEMMARFREEIQDGDNQTVADFLSDCHQNGRALPAMKAPNSKRPDGLAIAKRYLCLTLDVGASALNRLPESGLSLEYGCPTISANGKIDGEPWVSSIDFYDVERLKAHLASACFVVTAYLSGMRTEECRALKRGCCTPVHAADDAPSHYQIAGLTFKGALDRDGNTIIGGEQREHPWLVIQPVARAIEIAEAISNSEYVFSRRSFQSIRPRGGQDLAIQSDAALDAVTGLIDWWNQHCRANNRLHELIPADPEGKVTPKRLRRTLAWFIYRKPGGRIALGVQYGHLRGYTSDGYGSRVSQGLRDVFPMEEAFAVAESLQEAADRLDSGEAASGPAAKRYLSGVHSYQAQYAGDWLTPRQAAALRRDPQLRIFDNSEQFLACVYDQRKSLCHPESESNSPDHIRTPSLSRCQSNCGNIARTDTHAQAILEQITQLQQQVERPQTPLPMRQRLTDRIQTMQALIRTHQQDRRST